MPPTITAQAKANGVVLSWNAADFGNATEFVIYRDGKPLASVNAANGNAQNSNGTWTYSDVWFETIEQMRGEIAGADVTASRGTNGTYTYSDKEYTVKAGSVVSAEVQAKPNVSKIAYFTFAEANSGANAGEINGGNPGWTNTISNGLEYETPSASSENRFATKIDTAQTLTSGSNTITTKYQTAADNATFAYNDVTSRKKAGLLLAAKNGTAAKASYFNLVLKNENFSSETAADYEFWINADVKTDNWHEIKSFSLKGATENEGNYSYKSFVPDKKDSGISDESMKKFPTNPSFKFVVPESLTGADRYATYKFNVNRIIRKYISGNANNQSYSKLKFHAPYSSSGAFGSTASYNEDGEMAAIHSVAVIASADVLDGAVKDTYEGTIALTVTPKANGVVVEWDANNFSSAASYALYRDGVKVTDITSANADYDTVTGHYKYNDVYFETLEQMRSEGGKSPAVSLENHTYYIVGGDEQTKTVTATADTTKIAYYTLEEVDDFDKSQANIYNVFNDGNADKGLKLNKFTGPNQRLDFNSTAVSFGMSGYTSYTTKYTVSSEATSSAHNNVSYYGIMHGKKAAGLVAAKKDDQTKPWASSYQFTIASTAFTDTTAQDYTLWMNASLKEGAYLGNTYFADFASTGEVVPDDANAKIDLLVDDNNNTFKQTFTSTNHTSTYATYKFKKNAVMNNVSGTRDFTFRAAGSQNEDNAVTTDNMASYNADGEMAAIHSVAIMKTADCISAPKVQEGKTDEEKLQEAYDRLLIMRESETSDVPLDSYGVNGTTVSWSSSDTSVVGNDGKVYPKVGENSSATLTATISLAGSSKTKTKTFTINVPAVEEYEIEGIKFSDSSVNASALADGKTINKITVRRFAETATAVTAVVALYNGNTMVDKAVNTLTPTAERFGYGELTLTNTITLPAQVLSTHSVKVFLLENTSTLRPVAESYSLKKKLNDSLTIYMAGDSTMQTYGDSSYPTQGWGKFFEESFNDKVTVVNKAMGGRTVKSFRTENRYTDIKNNISEGDYLFVQFGHNDAKLSDAVLGGTSSTPISYHTGIGTYATDQNGNVSDIDKMGDNLYNYSYFAYLQNYVDMAKEKGAHIVLLTSFNRAYENENNLQGYPAAMRAFAQERGIPCIDATAYSTALFSAALQKGETLKAQNKVTSKYDFAYNLFLFYKENDARLDSDKLQASTVTNFSDKTHFNAFGAKARARIAALALKEIGDPLYSYVTEEKTTMTSLYTDIVDAITSPYYGEVQ